LHVEVLYHQIPNLVHSHGNQTNWDMDPHDHYEWLQKAEDIK